MLLLSLLLLFQLRSLDAWAKSSTDFGRDQKDRCGGKNLHGVVDLFGRLGWLSSVWFVLLSGKENVYEMKKKFFDPRFWSWWTWTTGTSNIIQGPRLSVIIFYILIFRLRNITWQPCFDCFVLNIPFWIHQAWGCTYYLELRSGIFELNPTRKWLVYDIADLGHSCHIFCSISLSFARFLSLVLLYVYSIIFYQCTSLPTPWVENLIVAGLGLTYAGWPLRTSWFAPLFRRVVLAGIAWLFVDTPLLHPHFFIGGSGVVHKITFWTYRAEYARPFTDRNSNANVGSLFRGKILTRLETPRITRK